MTEPVHKRIDEGLKRGPRQKTGPKPSSPRRDNGQFLPVLSNSPQDIARALQDYANGATLEQLAKEHGVSRQAIYGWLLGELGGEQHSALVTRALTARIAKGDEMLDTATNPLDLQRGREQARNARLDLERRRANLYGAKSMIDVTVQQVTIEQSLSNSSLALLSKLRGEPIEVEGGVVPSLTSEPPPE